MYIIYKFHSVCIIIPDKGVNDLCCQIVIRKDNIFTINRKVCVDVYDFTKFRGPDIKSTVGIKNNRIKFTPLIKIRRGYTLQELYI